MKKHLYIVAAGAALILTACIPSVHPFFTAKDVVFEPGLVGEWSGKDKDKNPESWKFGAGTNSQYSLMVVEGAGKEGQFTATLFKLKGERFLDLIPSDCNYASNQADLVGGAMFPGHLLARVSQIEPSLKLAFFDFDWLAKYLEQNPKALAHQNVDKRLLLTASTKDLQAFVLAHLKPGELFDKPGELERKPAQGEH
jgi:hypothetical protein